MEDYIKGKVVIITGASSDLGEASTKHLSKLGATVLLGARRADRIEKLAKEIRDKGGKALAIAGLLELLDKISRMMLLRNFHLTSFIPKEFHCLNFVSNALVFIPAVKYY